MQQNPTFPSRTQIADVRRLVETGLFSIPMIARLTGVPFRDVFRIAKSMLEPIVVGPEGAVLDGNHRPDVEAQ